VDILSGTNPFNDPRYVNPIMVAHDADKGLKRLEFPDGFFCYTHSSEIEAAIIYNEVFVRREYLRSRLSIENCCCVFDVGANIGLFSLFCKMKNPTTQVFAFEPIEATYDVLCKNIESHRATGIYTFNYAVGSRDEAASTMTYYPNLAGNSTRHPDDKIPLKKLLTETLGEGQADYIMRAEQVNNVRMRTLSSVISEHGITAIDLLKVDTEGDELAVLQGIDDTHFPIIRQIAAEVHGEPMLAQVTSLLDSKGYQVSLRGGITGGGNSNVYATR
jgi:FkbM family methyltransferase